MDSYLLDSSCTTTGTGVNRYSNQSDKLLPNGQNAYTPLPTHIEPGVNDLSVIDCSVIDSEYVTEYCHQNMQVSNEKRRYSSGSEDDVNDNVSRESTSKNRLSYLSTDSELKIQSDFADNDSCKINYIDGNDEKVDEKKDNVGEFAKDFISNLIDSVRKEFPETKDKNIYDCLENRENLDKETNSQEKLENKTTKLLAVKTNSTPNIQVVANGDVHSEPIVDMQRQPLLRSLPDINGDVKPC